MIIYELIDLLKDFNPKAKVTVIVHCRNEKFTITYGNSEGVTKATCDEVSFYVDRLCQNEKEDK